MRALAFFSLVLIDRQPDLRQPLLQRVADHRAAPAESRRSYGCCLPCRSMLGLTLLWPFAQRLFRFGPLHLDDLAVTLAPGIVVLVSLEALKSAGRGRFKIAEDRP